ncbi:hypothetical protein [Pseudonocardia sp. ICBG1293]|uniref:hypothetical protein n=1 Tax=Pseudonocardia sp. ICBG1293 TaxID=2844382 RepID=UPI001CCB26C4|nr:hypothetical protein [Pseudonocardia sp. ICBG1293]
MDLIDYLACVGLSGLSGALAGRAAVRRMLWTRPPRGSVMRSWRGGGPPGGPRRRRRAG